MDEYIVKDNKKLRFGYTTGSCAAAASKAATYMLLYQRKIDTITLMTPKGIMLHLEVLEGTFDKDRAYCGIKKDSGDDPDVTNEILIYALVEKTKEQGIVLDGGIGVGRVTKKGLEQEIGEPAINKVPRKMIKDAIGDMYVVLTILALQLDLDIGDCVAMAYEEIRDRKGKMVNGVFVKEDDLE